MQRDMKTCSKCKIEKEIIDFYKYKRVKNDYGNKCKDCVKTEEEPIKNALKKERINLYNKKHRNIYLKNKRKNDSLFKIKENLRTRTYLAFKYKSWRKQGTEKLLGTDYLTCKKYIESKFTNGMNWSNHGEWHIDHIIPLASAETETDLIKLCHYTNLQPLWAFDNLSKGAKIIP